MDNLASGDPRMVSRPRDGWRSWLPPALWAVLLFGLSSIPGSRIPPLRISFADKLAHTFLYGVLGWLCFRALQRTARIGRPAAVVAAAAIALAYGITDEIHQMFVVLRSADAMDVAADVAGGFLGAGFGWLRARQTTQGQGQELPRQPGRRA